MPYMLLFFFAIAFLVFQEGRDDKALEAARLLVKYEEMKCSSKAIAQPAQSEELEE